MAAADGRTLRDVIGQKSAHGFGFWDAMLMETRLLTEDMHDARRVGALRLKNPFKADFDLGLD